MIRTAEQQNVITDWIIRSTAEFKRTGAPKVQRLRGPFSSTKF
jgi:hypothetical protein